MDFRKILSILFVILVIGSALIVPVAASDRDNSHVSNTMNGNSAENIGDKNKISSYNSGGIKEEMESHRDDNHDEDREKTDSHSDDEHDEDREKLDSHSDDDRDDIRVKVRFEMEMSPRMKAIDAQNRYLFDKGGLETRLLAMDSIIDYAKDHEIDASKLIDVRDEFKDLIDELREASDEGDFDDYLEHHDDLMYIDSYFKKLVSDNSKLRGSEFESAVKEALNKGLIKDEEYKKEARNKYRNSAIEKMDDNIKRCKKVIEKTKESGFDAFELEDILKGIEANYTKLNEAFVNEDYENIPAIIQEIKDNLLEFRTIAESLKEDVILANLESHITTAANVISRAGAILDVLESININVSELRTDLMITSGHVDNARTNYDNSSMRIARDDLVEARTTFKIFISHLKQVLLFEFSDAGVIEADNEGNSI